MKNAKLALFKYNRAETVTAYSFYNKRCIVYYLLFRHWLSVAFCYRRNRIYCCGSSQYADSHACV